VRPAVETERCFVSFSGGRDSSAVLAAATAVARGAGLPLPVPVTIRAEHAPRSHESEFQESVVRHLGLSEWIRLEVEDELDALGPYARRGLERHGLLWPFNAHFHAPMLEQAAGGVLLTGIGGDELWSAAHTRRLSWRRRVFAFAPGPLRREVLARRIPLRYPWLTAPAARQAQRAAAHDAAQQSRTVRGRMEQARSLRYLGVGTASLALLAADAGAELAHPLLDLGLWSAVAAAAPRGGFQGPRAALRATAGHLLPDDLLSRTSKASFDAIFFHTHSRQLAEAWTGEGVPAGLVDERALRKHWLSEQPDSHSLTLVQSAWLASAGDRLDEARSRVA
jgi:asparagine synthase (glutamine-hydrolysing)